MQHSTLHPKILVTDVKDNQKLLSDAQIKKAKRIIDKRNNDSRKNNKSIVFRHKIKTLDKESNRIVNIISYNDSYFVLNRGKEQKLGSGCSGEVKLMQDVDTGKLWVLKIVRYPTRPTNSGQNSTENILKRLCDVAEKEVNALKMSGSENAFFYTRQSKNNYLQVEIAMEAAAGCELISLLEEYKVEKDNCWIISDAIVLAVKNLFEKGLLHRDIKPENIMYCQSTEQATLIDMGDALVHLKGEAAATFAGTTGYVAPEVSVHGNSNVQLTYNEATEVYALGTTLGNLLGFIDLGLDPNTSFFAMTETDFVVKDTDLRGEVFAFILQMRDENPQARPSLNEVYSYFNGLALQQRDQNICVHSETKTQLYMSSSAVLFRAPANVQTDDANASPKKLL